MTKKIRVRLKNDFFLYLLILPAILLTVVFVYLPMPGIIMAFQDYDIFLGPLKSPFVGLKNIIGFLHTPELTGSVWNTLKLSILSLVIGFPAPIILALMFNELRAGLFKKIAQTVSYLPYFLSWISVIGMFTAFYSLYGPLNDLRVQLYGPDTERILFLSLQELFIPNVLLLGLWKDTGWGTVIYLASIASIDSQLYEAANIDGASKWKQTIHITLPGIMPVAVILLILSIGNLFGSNFELIYGLKNPFINFEVISTVVYRYGIKEGNFSMATAVGFLQGVIAFLLILGSNKIAKKVSDTGIW